MTITFRYRSQGLLKLETVTLKHVKSIVETGVKEYAIECYGNGPVTWRGVSQIRVASESAQTVAVSLDIPKPNTEPKPRKLYKCFTCGGPFYFARLSNDAVRRYNPDATLHECKSHSAYLCERCGSVKPVGQSCGCFDNDSQ